MNRLYITLFFNIVYNVVAGIVQTFINPLEHTVVCETL